MGNKTYAKEWMQFAYKNLATAILLYEAEHFEDIIGVELQQFFEKSLKSLFAYKNQKIPKNHDLIELLALLEFAEELEEEEIDLISLASDYYKDDRYPNPNYDLPSREEIEKVLEFANKFYEQVCQILDINKDEILDAR